MNSMREPRDIRNLVLIGFMATGKSTVGRWVAHKLNFEFLDTDALIEERTQKKVSDIFAEEGEARFREYERQVVEELQTRSRLVVATGGGLAAQGDNLQRLKQHALVVCLWAGPETIWRRASRHSHRPLLNDPDPEAKIRLLLAARTPYYRQADVLVNTEQRSTRQVAEHVFHEFVSVSHTASQDAPGGMAGEGP